MKCNFKVTYNSADKAVVEFDARKICLGQLLELAEQFICKDETRVFLVRDYGDHFCLEQEEPELKCDCCGSTPCSCIGQDEAENVKP